MAKPYYNRERKSWGLRASNQPKRHPYLSGTVLVIDHEGRGYAYIQFEEAFIQAVGKALTMGIGPQCRAYLRVIEHVQRSGDEAVSFSVYVCPIERNAGGVFILSYTGAVPWLGDTHRGLR